MPVYYSVIKTDEGQRNTAFFLVNFDSKESYLRNHGTEG